MLRAATCCVETTFLRPPGNRWAPVRVSVLPSRRRTVASPTPEVRPIAPVRVLASRVTEASTPSMKKVGSHRMVVVASVLNFNIRDALRVFLWLVASSDAARLVRQSGIWEVVRVCRLAPPGRMCREDACIDL